MKIYIERKIESEKDLPKEPGFYYIHYKHPNDMVHTQMSVVYYDETIKGLWFGKDWYDYWLDPIEVSDERAAKIPLVEQIYYQNVDTNDNVLERTKNIFKAMQEYAAIQVAKALNKTIELSEIEKLAQSVNPYDTRSVKAGRKKFKAALSGQIKKRK